MLKFYEIKGSFSFYFTLFDFDFYLFTYLFLKGRFTCKHIEIGIIEGAITLIL